MADMQSVESPDELTDADLAIWQPWSARLVAVIDAVRSVLASNGDDAGKRAQVAELGAEANELLGLLGAQPVLPGSFGRAVDLLRSPEGAEPLHIAEAIDRLTSLAHLVRPCSPTLPAARPGRVRHRPQRVADQPELPGLVPITQGATP